ncbi:C1 family peptidase [Methanobrevibacter sp.]|uniref:C1 family peptidase n=1 Tax=Methanobrevibacter sp. TaxID=66852 RepID=UPI003868D67E
MLLVFFILPSSFAISNDTDILDESGINDYYFNASVDIEGNGSQISPYKYLTDDKLINDSIIYLSNGEYELNKGKTISNVTVVGECTKNTIVKFKNNNSILTSLGTLTLKNLTLVDLSIINYATLNADNVIFKDSTAYLRQTQGSNIVNSAVNSYGGAIYCPYNVNCTAHVNLNNCSFLNNTGEYGGAIYMAGGSLDIKNSLFYDNFAYNYGGAIACEYDSKINIEKSKFINSRSINDAGGAIYITNSKLTADNINISNSQSTFGSAITSLSSTVTLNHLKAYSNTAKYDGGAIFQFYGSFTLRNSEFLNNSAVNGGAVFIDNTTSTILYQNTFTNNKALNQAGAVYSLFNTKIRNNYNEYFDNKAKYEADFYETLTLGLVFGNGNYSLYKYNSNFSQELPSNYSSLDNGFVTSVKDQQSGGNCWAFAGIGVLESCILKASGDNIDLSEENMKNLAALYSDYGWEMNTNEGGILDMTMAYLLSWRGPVLESDDRYDDKSYLSPILNSTMHVQNVKFIKRTSYTDNDAIKEAIYKYGAVGTGIYFDYDYFNNETSSYYGEITISTNHAVTVVGWDDNYSKDNFVKTPLGDGAFLVKNSWDTDWGNDGYFYVSYYDTSFARIGDPEASYTFILNDTIKFDKNYQYDIIGKTDYFISDCDEIWYENIFNSTDDEFLAAVSTYFEKSCNWDLYIYVNDILKLSKNGTGECGYYTIDLGEYIALKNQDTFKIVFKINAADSSFPICEKSVSTKDLYGSGVSFFSFDGVNWTDLYTYNGKSSSHIYSSQLACIKAFTFLDEIKSSIYLNISKKDCNPIDIVADVVNQYGNLVTGGNVTFNVNGKDYSVKVVNGIAKLTLNLIELSLNNVSAIFNGVGYLQSNASDSIYISKILADIDFNVSKYMNNVNIKFKVSKSINETVNVIVNNVSYPIKIVDGVGLLSLNDLENGNYTFNASILNSNYVTSFNFENFNVNVKKSNIAASNINTYFRSGEVFKIILTDENGLPISNHIVDFDINGLSFSNLTDSNGTILIPLCLDVGEYSIISKFSGDENYFNSSSTNKIIVNSTIESNLKEIYLLNTIYSFKLLNKDGNPLSNTNVSVIVGDRQYFASSDVNGTVFINIDLKPGTYQALIINPLNNENLTETINVAARIVDNKDLTMFFNSGSVYKVRVLGDDGEFVGSGELVKFIINNKSYTKKTDVKGYASLKITLPAKTYTVKSEYKGFKVSNKIVVKPVLTAKNISKKKAKAIKFQAKLVNSKGKALKNKKLIFKFKGKTFKIKTNSKGIATLKLKNLKVGKYTITTKYSKSTIKNTIRIKK